MKKIMIKFLTACLVISLLPLSAFAGYTNDDYSVSLKATKSRIYEGETVDISFNINLEDFLMTDMSVGYKTQYFTYGNDTTGVVEFETPEIKGAGQPDGKGGYDLDNKFQFAANQVTDTVEVEFTIENADIVYSYESAKNDEPTQVNNKSGVSVIIVKQYDVSFVDEDGSTLIGNVQKVDKGLGSEEDTALTVPDILYDEYVKAGLDKAYYEHVWKYNGTEYTDDEVAAFGKTASSNEITEDTAFVLDVREKTFNVTVPAEDFDITATPDKATYGSEYTGKINQYDDKYDYTVKYEINGNTQTVDCDGDRFTIPGQNIIGDMTLSFEKELNIVIEAYEYFTGHFLITVDGSAVGYTFEGYDMYKSENHDNLRAWVFDSGVLPGESMTTEEAEAIVEDMIYTSNTISAVAPAGYDINESEVVDIKDAALAHGAYTGGLIPLENWVKEYLSADVDQNYKVNTLDYDKIVEIYKA